MAAILVLVVVTVVVILVGVAAHRGVLDGSQTDIGTVRLLPLTTTTT